jgi:microcystin-dependent protein
VPDSYTTGKLGLIEPARGGYVDTWDEPLYANWQTLEAAISGTTTLTLTNANVVLTVPTFPTNNDPPTVSTSCQNLRLYLTGTLAANLTVFIPATVGGFWIIDDATTGSFTVTIKTTAVGSTGVNSAQGKSIIVFSDGTNVKLADSGIIPAAPLLVPPGTIINYAGNAAFPTGYLNCDGSAISRTTYSDLFTAIGTTWGSGNGSTTFNLPQLQNMFVRGAGGSNPAGFYEDQSIQSHTHTLNDPGHMHDVPQSQRGLFGGSNPVPSSQAGTIYPNILVTTTAQTGITISATGSAETKPANYRLWYLIKT